MFLSQILDIFEIKSSGPDRVLKNDGEILDDVKNAYQMAKRYDEIFNDESQWEDDGK